MGLASEFQLKGTLAWPVSRAGRQLLGPSPSHHPFVEAVVASDLWHPGLHGGPCQLSLAGGGLGGILLQAQVWGPVPVPLTAGPSPPRPPRATLGPRQGHMSQVGGASMWCLSFSEALPQASREGRRSGAREGRPGHAPERPWYWQRTDRALGRSFSDG